MAFTIPSELFTIYAEYADAMLVTSGFGVTCKLVYTDKITTTSQPVSDIGKRLSMNPSSNGGFNHNGDNFKMVEVTEDIVMRVYWSQAEFKKFSNIQIPEGGVMCISRYADLPSINKAKALIINTGKTGNVEWRFEKSAEPTIHGLDNNYLMSYWKRI
jgi:hypothetical protein